MDALPSKPSLLSFGIFKVDLKTSELRKAGIKQKLAPQPFQVLQALVERRGEVVTREQLRDLLWPDHTFVDYDLALKKAINRLREVLGDSADAPRFIETIPRQGYRFIAEVRRTEPAEARTTPVRRPISWKLGIGVAVAAATVLLVAVNAGKLRTRIFANSRAAEIRSIAVLPFLNLSNDPQQEFFVDGMTDELITDLAKIGELRVISRTSVMPYKSTHKPLGVIAQELNVDAVVEGTVLRSGGRVRVTAQLIRVPVERHLWADSFQRDLSDVLSLQSEVASKIAERVRVQLTPAEQALLTNARLPNTEAYDAYVKGRFYSRELTPDGFDKGILNFSRAIELEPRYAQAYADLAEIYCWSAASGASPAQESLLKARDAAMKALELDERIGQAHDALAWVKYANQWNFPEAEREFARSLQLNPSSSWAHLWYGMYLSQANRIDESLAQMKTAKQLDPLSPVINSMALTPLMLGRRYDEVIENATGILERDPANGVAHWIITEALQRKGDLLQAMDAQEKMAMAFGQTAEAAARDFAPLRRAYTNLGPKAYWQARLERQKAEFKKNPGDPYDLAVLYARVRDARNAFALLDRAYHVQSQGLTFWLRTDPAFDGLRADARYTNLIQRVGFPQ